MLEAELGRPIVFIETLNVPYGRLWVRDLCSGTMDAYMAVLRAHLPSLLVLRLGPIFAKVSQVVGMILRSALYQSRELGLPNF